MLYLITAMVGGILARALYPGVSHVAPIASVLLAVPGSHFAGFAGKIFHPWDRQGPSVGARLAYSTLGALLLMSLAETALNFAR